MGAFSASMRSLALQLCTDLGNTCVLTEVQRGSYDPLTGNIAEIRTDYPTYSAQASKYNETFGRDGVNTNLDAFRHETLVVPWLGIGKNIDSTWEYNGHSILTVEETTTQNELIIWTITVGEKK